MPCYFLGVGFKALELTKKLIVVASSSVVEAVAKGRQTRSLTTEEFYSTCPAGNLLSLVQKKHYLTSPFMKYSQPPFVKRSLHIRPKAVHFVGNEQFVAIERDLHEIF